MSFQKRLGPCSLHPVYTAFRNGLQELSFNLDLFFEDICFFFKRSNVITHYAMWHATKHWLRMKYVAVRIYNLTEYFFTVLPKQKREYYLVKKTECYQIIVKALRVNLSISYVCLFVHLHHFKAFLLLFQYDQLIILMLYPALIKLLLDIFVKLIKQSALFINKSVCLNKNLLVINPLSPNNKSLNLVDIDTEAKTLFSNQSVISNEEQTKFCKECL